MYAAVQEADAGVDVANQVGMTVQVGLKIEIFIISRDLNYKIQ